MITKQLKMTIIVIFNCLLISNTIIVFESTEFSENYFVWQLLCFKTYCLNTFTFTTFNKVILTPHLKRFSKNIHLQALKRSKL